MRSSEIRKSVIIEPIFLWVERSHLRWFGHVSKMPQERLPKQPLLAKANGRRPVGRPRTRWTNYIVDLDGIAWGFTQAKRWMWWKTVKYGGLISSWCNSSPHGKAGNKERQRRRHFQAHNYDYAKRRFKPDNKASARKISCRRARQTRITQLYQSRKFASSC